MPTACDQDEGPPDCYRAFVIGVKTAGALP